ncbi:hypothetical protein WAI453_012401 [Rhynchosporium graminicola]|uniref:Uncharacterized protein n=1 Tax=Rhynchosporium graminicola TaxID=2792576 RepID=A0A1E1KYI6_9HELO|nr:uncharacterized protein RCO7_06208 [Rhynchosporium commune]
MPTIRPREHVWTAFELHTMLCLITKGVHLEQRPNKRTEERTVTRANAYENFYTALNNAVHGKDFNRDIHKKEVTRMLDQMLAERKHVVGLGGLVERQRNGRVTRALSMAWNRSKCNDYDGSVGEWDQGRKEKVMMQYKITRGIIAAPVEVPGEDRDIAMAGDDVINEVSSMKDLCLTQVQDTGRSRWRTERERAYESISPDRAPAVQNPSLTKTHLDSFRILPETLKSSSKFDWATNPGTNRDNYARSEISTIDRPLRRAGLRNRELSRPMEAKYIGNVYQADRMRLPHEAYRSSTTLKSGFSTSKIFDKRDYHSTDKNYYSSTPDFGDGYSTPMDMSPQTTTPVSRLSTNPSIRSSRDSSLQASHKLKINSRKETSAGLERALAGELNQDVDMMDDLEADLTAAMEAQSQDQMMA